MDTVSLQIVDYVVLVIMLIIPLGIGVFFAIRDAKRLTREEYLLGGRHMAMVPVMLSIFVTFQSAISLIGLPSETYTYGPLYFGLYIGMSVSYLLASFTITPLLYPLRITSVYEYLEMRFESKSVRLISTILGMLQSFFYLAVALLAPGLALEAAAGIPFWVSVVIVGATGTIYTAVGGMKSVVWTDAFQTIIVFVGIFAVIIKSSSEAGGIGKSWEMAEAGGRTDFNNFFPDPRIRHTWYGIVLGGTTAWMSNLFGQATCQRISSMKTLKDARMAMFLNIPLNTFFGFVCTAMGWCMYSYYLHIQCDPFEAGIVNNRNQMTPFFVIHAMSDLPGFAGVYMSSVFSGSLSTLSSGINALAANTVEDLLKKPMKSVTEKTATTITKIAVFFYGTVIVIVVYLSKNLKGHVTQMSVSVIGCFGSTVLGMFLLGCTIPWGNKYGALAGAVISLAMNVWLVIGNQLYGRDIATLEPVPTAGCFNDTSLMEYDLLLNTSNSHSNLTVFYLTEHETTTGKLIDSLPDRFSVYDISYEWYSVFGVFVCFIVGIIVSRITRNRVSSVPDPKLIIPCLRKAWGIGMVNAKTLQETKGLIKEEGDIETEL